MNHQGWDQYLTVPLLDENTPTPLDASSIQWDRLIVVSFSAGTTDVAYLARQQMLDGAVYLDGPVEGSPDLNVWDLPMATPDCVQAGAYHADRGVETLQIQDVWTRMGVGTVELDADLGWSGSWPAGEMRFFSNQVPAPGGCIDPKHGSMARDGCIPSDPWNGLPAGRVYGTPSLFPTYVYLFCQVGAIEPVTCMPYQDLQPRDSDGPRLP